MSDDSKRDPEQEDKIFTLDPAKVRVNDIVLTADSKTTSRVIRGITSSDFSHAALCTRDHMLLEAVREGAIRKYPMGVYVEKKEWLRVLRAKENTFNNASGLTVADHAEALYGRPYSVLGAIGSVVPGLTGAEGAVFCSHLVALAFEACGVRLVPGKESSQVTPGLLATSSMLIDVTEECVMEVDCKLEPDRCRSIKRIGENAEATAEIRMNRQTLKALRDKVGDVIPRECYSIHELWIWLRQHAGIEAVRAADTEIFATLEREGFVQWYEDWLNRLEADIVVIDWLSSLVEKTNEKGTAEVAQVRNDVGNAVKLGDIVLAGRHDTMLASENGTNDLRTLQYLNEKYRREFDTQTDLQRAKRRLLGALDRVLALDR